MKIESNSFPSTPDMIEEILSRYNIGKRPLSLLLGWGELTVSRYLDGQDPSQGYEDTLRKIYNNPGVYYELLNENRSNLHSQLAYNKSCRATEDILGISKDDSSNLNPIATYILNECENEITPLTLQKSLYYVQGFYSAFYNDFLIDEDCEAWAHGPVYRKIYYRYSNYHYQKIGKVDSRENVEFSDAEIGLIDSVIKHFCCYSGKVLESFTHKETPWLSARNGLPSGVLSDEIITKESIKSFFTNIKEKYNMTTPADIYEYPKEMFNNA